MRVVTLLLLAALAAPTVLAAQEQERVVRGLTFVGNRAIDDLTLASAIATTKSSWWATFVLVRWTGLGEKRYFDELEFRRDVVRILLLYRQSGYMGAAVDTVVRRTPRDVYVTFLIHEGEPVRVTELDIAGLEGLFDVVKLKRELPLQVGDPFNRFLMQASADTIVARLRNNGFPYAEVLRNFDSDAGQLKAEVALEAIPGPLMKIGEVSIRGLRAIDTGTVRRVMTVRPGRRYKQDELYQTQRDLYSMGVFNAVNVVLVDSAAHQIGADSTVRLLVNLHEGPRHQIRFGLGYGSIECVRVQSGWAVHNFLGGARTLDLTGRVSKLGGTPPKKTEGLNQFCSPFTGTWTFDTLNYNLGVTLRQPAFLSRSHTASVGFFAERRSEVNIYTREAIGGNADVTFNARGTISATLGYTYSVGRTVAEPAIFCNLFRICDDSSRAFLENRRQFGAVTLTVLRNRVNNVLDATEGSIATLTLLHASRFVGSQVPYEFNRGEIEFSKYHPIGRRTVFAWRIRAGTLLTQSLNLLGQRVGYVPPDQRFYGGGPNSVRGYGRNELGPRVYVVTDTTVLDTAATNTAGEKVFTGVTTAPTGGNTATVVNAELRLPSPIFSSRMRLGVFVDMGQVWERGEEVVTIRGVRVTPGVGVRFATPLGPIRIDAAYNGYPAERGPLLYQPPSPQPITVIRPSYPPVRTEKRFWDKVVIQFAVGQAF